MDHARLSCSNLRWPNCPGSVRESADYEDIPGAAAIDGTGSHLLLEMCLKNNVVAKAYDQQIIGVNDEENPNGWLIDNERCKRVQMCLDYVHRRVDDLKQQFPNANVQVFTEARTNPGIYFGRDDWWGTCDITIMAKHRMLGDVLFIEVIDYKDGQGWVDEKDNTQLNSYLFGQMLPYLGGGEILKSELIGGCRMTIVQPKTSRPVRYVDTDPKNVVDTAFYLSKRAKLTDDPNAELTPGKHCQWCPANPKRGGHCTADATKTLNEVTQLTTNITAGSTDLHQQLSAAVTDVTALSVDELSQLADMEPGMSAIFDKIKAEIQVRLENQIPVPGYALEPGKGSRQWNKPEEEIVKKLKARRLKKDDIYPSKLISPAQVEKLDKLSDSQKASLIEELVSYVASKKKVLKRVEHKDTSKDTTEMFAEVPDWVADANFIDETEDVSFF